MLHQVFLLFLYIGVIINIAMKKTLILSVAALLLFSCKDKETTLQYYTTPYTYDIVNVQMPPVTNEVITLVKDTSLAFAIAFVEMFTLAKQISASESNIMPLFVAGLFYYIFNLVVSFVMGQIEKKMNYYSS